MNYHDVFLEMYFGYLNRPINVFGNISSSYDNGNKIDTSIFVQNPYLRINFNKSNIEEDIKLENQFKTKILPYPVENTDDVYKSNLESGLNDPCIIRNTAHVKFNDKNLDIVHFVKVNNLPVVRERLTQKLYADEAVSYIMDESSLLRLDPDGKLKLGEQDPIIFISTLSSLKTTSYIGSLHENSRNRRDLSSEFNDHGNEFQNNNPTNLHGNTVNRDPI